MKHLAQTRIAEKTSAEEAKIATLKTVFSETVDKILANTPPISKGQKAPTRSELLTHIEKPKGYTTDTRRGKYLDDLLLNAGLTIWHNNGIPVLVGGTTKDALVLKDVLVVVKSLLSDIVPEKSPM